MKTTNVWSSSDLKFVKSFFEGRLKPDSENYEIMGYGSKESPVIRYEVATEIGDLQGKSILDYGCCLGDFVEYLEKRQIKVKYTGYDISEKIIERAQELHPKYSFEVRDIMKKLPNRKFSYVFAIGLNLKIADNVGFIRELIKRMFQIAEEGVFVSVLSSHGDYFDPQCFYHDPALLLDWCLREVSGKCILRHDYLPHDFALYIYKNHFHRGGEQPKWV